MFMGVLRKIYNSFMKILPEQFRIMDFIPRKDTEANLQYRFMKACEAYGLKVFSQYPSRWNESPGCRFDIVVHNGQYILALVEIKRNSSNKKRGELWRNTRQCKKYLSFGRPVFLVYDENDFAQVLNAIYDLEVKKDYGQAQGEH